MLGVKLAKCCSADLKESNMLRLQDTYVDISSFLPVVNEALQLIQHTVTPK